LSLLVQTPFLACYAMQREGVSHDVYL
jgi:hypothetical protein